MMVGTERPCRSRLRLEGAGGGCDRGGGERQPRAVPRRSRRLKDLTAYRWALQPPGAPTRDWLDHTFDRKRLPRPRVQVESTMLLMLPTLIAQTGLLSFISRHHLEGGKAASR